MYKKKKSPGILTVFSKAWLHLRKKKGENNALTFLLNATSWRIIDRGGLIDFHGNLTSALLHILMYSLLHP